MDVRLAIILLHSYIEFGGNFSFKCCINICLSMHLKLFVFVYPLKVCSESCNQVSNSSGEFFCASTPRVGYESNE